MNFIGCVAIRDGELTVQADPGAVELQMDVHGLIKRARLTSAQAEKLAAALTRAAAAAAGASLPDVGIGL